MDTSLTLAVEKKETESVQPNNPGAKGAAGTTDKHARLLGWLSIVVSVLALTVSFWQQQTSLDLQRRQFEVAQSEGLTARLNMFVNGPIRVLDHRLGDKSVVQIPCELTIANTGNPKLSFESYRLYAGPKGARSWYTGIDGGLYDKSSVPMSLPMLIDSGESKKCVLYVGILVPDEVGAVLKAQKAASLSMKDAERALARAGMDLFGNPANILEYDDKTYIIEFGPAIKAAKAGMISCEIRTGRGNAVVASSTKYGVEE